MDDEDLSRACKDDFKLYTKCFFGFYYESKDQLSDIVAKII